MDAPPHARRRRAAGIVMRLRDVWARDRALLVALAAAATSAVAFGRVTEDYLTNDPLARWDVSFSHWLADRRTSVGVDAFRTIADLGSPAVSACLALVVCVVLYRRAAAADALFLALVLVGAQGAERRAQAGPSTARGGRSRSSTSTRTRSRAGTR